MYKRSLIFALLACLATQTLTCSAPEKSYKETEDFMPHWGSMILCECSAERNLAKDLSKKEILKNAIQEVFDRHITSTKYPSKGREACQQAIIESAILHARDDVITIVLSSKSLEAHAFFVTPEHVRLVNDIKEFNRQRLEHAQEKYEKYKRFVPTWLEQYFESLDFNFADIIGEPGSLQEWIYNDTEDESILTQDRVAYQAYALLSRHEQKKKLMKFCKHRRIYDELKSCICALDAIHATIEQRLVEQRAFKYVPTSSPRTHEHKPRHSAPAVLLPSLTFPRIVTYRHALTDPQRTKLRVPVRPNVTAKRASAPFRETRLSASFAPK